MELSVWRGEWGLGSISADCLEAMSYSKFCSALTAIHHRKYVFSSNMNAILWNSNTGKKVHGSTAIISYLKDENFNCDLHLSETDKADILAYKMMVHQKLLPAISYALWCDERNYAELLRPTLAKILTFPTNYTVPGRIQRARLEEVWTRFGFELSQNEIEVKLNKDARECLVALSEKLSTSSFFFGTRPTSFDAHVFSHLAILNKTPLPNATLVAHLRSFPNLVELVNRIHNKYIASEVRRNETKVTEKREWVGVVLSLGFAITLMLSYAVSKGILQIEYHPLSQ